MTPVKPIKLGVCNNCYKDLRIYDPASKFVVCPFCGALLSYSGNLSLVKKLFFAPSKCKPLSQLQLGGTFVFERKSYVAISRTRWRSYIKEYWEEPDGEKGYESIEWKFDEWCMKASDGSVIYISEDNEGMAFARSIQPVYPNLPVMQSLKDFSNNDPRIVTEEGYAILDYFEGECEEQPEKGEKLFFGQYTDEKTNYIVEWELGEDGKPTNTAYFKEAVAERSKMSESFYSPGNRKIDNLYLTNPLMSDTKRLCRTISLIGLVLSVVFLFVSWIIGPQTLLDASFPMGDTTTFKVSHSGGMDTYIMRNPITLDNTYSVYRVSMSANLSSYTETEGEIRILDHNFNELYIISGDFYYEYSEGETDQNTLVEKYFGLTKPGSFYLEVTIPNDGYTSFTYNVKIENGILLSRFFGIGILVFLVLYTYVFVPNGGAKVRKHFELLSSK